MTTKEKFLFIRSTVNSAAKLEFFRKSGLDVRELLRYYGGVSEKHIEENEENIITWDFPIVDSYNKKYNEVLIAELNKKTK